MIPIELFDQWINEAGQEPDKNGYALVYSEGWKQGLIAMRRKMDDWRRNQSRQKP